MEIAKHAEHSAHDPEADIDSRQAKRRRAIDLAQHKKKCTICHRGMKYKWPLFWRPSH